jgi:chemotaxis signal transduction protein
MSQKGVFVAEIDETSVTGLAGKYLIFRMADREYGIEIHETREVAGDIKITGLPDGRHYR